MPQKIRDQIVPYTNAWKDAQNVMDSLNRNSKFYNFNVYLLKAYQATSTLEAQADLIRISYYQTLTNPTQSEINAAKQAGYHFGINVELGAGWNYRKET